MGTGIRGKRPGSGKSVPYLSHEFVIQNHADIVTCVCMVFVVGLMFQTSSPLASTFIAPKHNVTDIETPAAAQLPSSVLYTYGLKDLCLIFFYTLSAIIFHAVIQEYILDVWLLHSFKLTNHFEKKWNLRHYLIKNERKISFITLKNLEISKFQF